MGIGSYLSKVDILAEPVGNVFHRGSAFKVLGFFIGDFSYLL